MRVFLPSKNCQLGRDEKGRKTEKVSGVVWFTFSSSLTPLPEKFKETSLRFPNEGKLKAKAVAPVNPPPSSFFFLFFFYFELVPGCQRFLEAKRVKLQRDCKFYLAANIFLFRGRSSCKGIWETSGLATGLGNFSRGRA